MLFQDLHIQACQPSLRDKRSVLQQVEHQHRVIHESAYRYLGSQELRTHVSAPA